MTNGRVLGHIVGLPPVCIAGTFSKRITCLTQLIVYRPNEPKLKIRFQEHIRYIRSNNLRSAFAQHTLQNQHEYGQMNCIMTLLKPLSSPSMLIPYEQYYIQTLHREGKLIPEQ